MKSGLQYWLGTRDENETILLSMFTDFFSSAVELTWETCALGLMGNCVPYAGPCDREGPGTRLWCELAPVHRVPTSLEPSCSR